MNLKSALAEIYYRLRYPFSLKLGKRCNLSLKSIIDPRLGAIHIGSGTRVAFGASLLAQNGVIRIGTDCSINPYAVLYGHGGLTIGNDVRIAAHVTIVPSNHIFSSREKPIRLQGYSKQGIVIEDDVWIGAHAVILDGAHISTGCVIGAGAVVKGRLEPYGVYVGSPARLIKMRDD